MWERRAPLAPQHVRKLVKKGIKVIVQPSNRRAYPAQSYQQVGFLEYDYCYTHSWRCLRNMIMVIVIPLFIEVSRFRHV